MITAANKHGFSLIELLIYVTVVSIIATVLVTFAIDLSTNAQKAKIHLEVQQNARFAMERMLQEIRTASSINTGSSIFESNPGTLSLAMPTPADDPTVFDVNSGILRISQGGNPAEDLTASTVEVSNLVFHNLSVSGRTETVQIEMTVQAVNPSQNSLYNASVSLTGTATVRAQEN